MKNFRRVEKINFNGNFYKLYIDKNDSVYEIMKTEVISWKRRGCKSFPDEIKERRSKFFDLVKGNPTKIAINKIIARLELNQEEV